MIISHHHKFIFIKNRKTAGTTMELALADLCEDGDVITHLSRRDEQIRNQNHLRGKQHIKIPLSFYKKEDWLYALRKLRPLTFKNHNYASFIKNHVHQSVWADYYKFCFVRNPYDKLISSYYHWKHREPHDSTTTIDDFVRKWVVVLANDEPNFYKIKGKTVLDAVYRYEDMDKALIDIARRIGYKREIELKFSAKAHFRTDRRPFHEVLSAASMELIHHHFKEVFDEFNYEK